MKDKTNPTAEEIQDALPAIPPVGGGWFPFSPTIKAGYELRYAPAATKGQGGEMAEPTHDEIRDFIEEAISHYDETFLGRESPDSKAAREYLRRTARVIAALEAGIPAPLLRFERWSFTDDLVTAPGLSAEQQENLNAWFRGGTGTWPTLTDAVLAAAQAAGLNTEES